MTKNQEYLERTIFIKMGYLLGTLQTTIKIII